MAGKFKYGKVAVVVFITVLIWVWADLALDERYPVSGAKITISKSANPSLWVSFNDELSVSIDNIVLKGPASRIAEVKRKLRQGRKPEFDFDAAQEKMDEPGDHTLIVLPFLQKNKEIKQLGLTIESCRPETLSVNIVELVKKLLVVKCVDQGRNPVKAATVEPARVDIFVRKDWVGDARVRLTRREVEQARVGFIEKVPYIELAAGQIRWAAATVKITMPPEEEMLQDYTITAARLGIALSPTLQGKYKVEITNLDAVMSPISVRATPEAKRAYELQPFPTITLYILDDDKNKTGEQRREVIYNFPQDYVRNGEIELKQQPVEARFKLILLSSGRPP